MMIPEGRDRRSSGIQFQIEWLGETRMMISRLASVAPDMEAAIANARPAMLRGVASLIARWAAERVGWSQPGGTGSSAIVAEELDERYLAFQELFESGGCSEAEVLAAFGLARAASCAAFASRGEASEAVYEAIMATDDLPGARRTLLSVLDESASIA